MKNVLVVEDNIEFRSLLVEILSTEYSVLQSPNIADAKYILDNKNADLVLLDLGLPDGSGYEVCTYIKSNEALSNIPVLIVSGNDTDSAKIAGFELGAEDYIVKPFSQAELLARVKAKVGRSSELAGPQNHGSPFEIDLEASTIVVVKTKSKLELSHTEFLLASCLIRKFNSFVDMSELIQVSSGEHHSLSAGSIERVINELKKKLQEQGVKIESDPEKGYSLQA